MCGICGFTGPDEGDLLARMTDAIEHRGPDDHGYFRHEHVSLGHRRLSIIDLAGGHQPMATPDGRLTIVFNGEIYNFREIKKRLEDDGVSFQTTSDTEVLLKLYEAKGPDALKELNGMFAFAIYDREKGELFVAPGPGSASSRSTTSSTADASTSLRRSRRCSANRAGLEDINATGLAHYLGLRYTPGHTTMLQSVKKLPRSSLLTAPGRLLRNPAATGSRHSTTAPTTRVTRSTSTSAPSVSSEASNDA